MKPKPKPETAHPEFDKALFRGIERANMNPGRRFGIFYHAETRGSYVLPLPTLPEPILESAVLICTVWYFETQTIIEWANGDPKHDN
jgi:hypothetical protein